MKKAVIKSIFIFCLTLLVSAQSIAFHIKVYRNRNMPSLPLSTQNTILKLKEIYPQPENTVRIKTYNILSDEPGFEGSPAYTRANGVCAVLNSLSPDVIGIQEMSHNWFYFLKANTRYSFVSPVKTALTSSMTAMLYDSEKLILKNSGEKTLSRSTSQRLRKYIWATFETTDTKSTFTVVNTHFSLNKNDSCAPLLQALDIIEFSKEFQQHSTIFFIGDFNTAQTTNKTTSSGRVYETLSTFFNDTKAMAKSLSEGTEKSSDEAFLDHIFLKGNAEILNFIILSNKEMAFFSDHYPILADVIIKR